MTQQQWDDNLKSHLREIQIGIQTRKYVIQNVFGSRSSDGFSYTIGLTEHHLPEIRVTQFHQQISQGLTIQLADALIKDHAGSFDNPRAAATALTGHPGYDIDVPDDHVDTARFRFKRPSMFDPLDMPLGMANNYYDRHVDYVDATTTGWPCPRCANLDATKPCTCQWSCWWRHCNRLSDYQRNLPRDQWV